MQKEPARTMNFTGSHKAVAQCVQRRLGGKVQEDRLGDERYVIYDSAKGMSSEGLTHWAITIGKYSPDEGFAEWRYVATPPTSRGAMATPIETPLSQTAVNTYWGAVEDCVRLAKGS